jgi:hypothetical protein
LQHVYTEWTLSLDADYKCPIELAAEIEALPAADANGYEASFQYCVYGKPLRGTLYPPRTVLYRTKLAQYARDGHAHRVHVTGDIGRLRTVIQHDDHKPLTRWLASQVKYAALEAEKICSKPPRELEWKDRVRSCYVAAPLLTFIYCLFVKRLIFDGRAGLHYTFQRVYAECLLSLELLDRRLRPRAEKHIQPQASSQPASQQSTDQDSETKQYELLHPRN